MDALAQNQSAMEMLGNKDFRKISSVLVEQLKQNVTVDWHLKESARAKLRILNRRILKKSGYPPDWAPAAINTALSQAETLLLSQHSLHSFARSLQHQPMNSVLPYLISQPSPLPTLKGEPMKFVLLSALSQLSLAVTALAQSYPVPEVLKDNPGRASTLWEEAVWASEFCRLQYFVDLATAARVFDTYGSLTDWHENPTPLIIEGNQAIRELFVVQLKEHGIEYMCGFIHGSHTSTLGWGYTSTYFLTRY